MRMMRNLAAHNRCIQRQRCQQRLGMRKTAIASAYVSTRLEIYSRHCMQGEHLHAAQRRHAALCQRTYMGARSPDTRHQSAAFLVALLCLLARITHTAGARPLQPPTSRSHVQAIDPLGTVQQLADCLYNKNDVDCIDQYCQPSVAVHGDGIWLPLTTFSGASWVKSIHRDWFTEYSDWNFRFLDVAATAAVKGFTEVLGFFRWDANNTGGYRGLPASNLRSQDYGLMHLSVDRKGLVTDVTIWRAGFREERQGLLLVAAYDDTITPLHDITDQPFWVPSQSLQLKMNTRAHALLEVLNQGDKFLDTLDDICTAGVLMLDGMHIWGPPMLEGVTQLKLWMAGWLQSYDVNAAVTASVTTPTSNKVFLCFKLLLADASAPSSLALQGCLLYVFNIQGFITHLVMYRNGTPKETADKFIGKGAAWPQPLAARVVHA